MPAGSLAEPLVAGRSTGDPRRPQQGPSKAVFRRELGKAEKGLEEEPGLCHPNSSGGSRLSALVCCGSTVLISRWLAALSGVAQKCCLGVLGLPLASPPRPGRWTEPSSTTNTPPEPLPPGPRVHAACHLNSPAHGHGLSGRALQVVAFPASPGI